MAIPARHLARFLAVILPLAAAAGTPDPFVGSWRLNRTKSRIKGNLVEIEVSSWGWYRFRPAPGIELTCKMDGIDRPTGSGKTLNCRKVNPRIYLTTVSDGKRPLTSATWKLAPNGRSMTIVNRVFRPDGTKIDETAFVERRSGKLGLSGTWQSTRIRESVPDQFEVRAWGSEGHLISRPAQQATLRIHYDGAEYALRGPLIASGTTASGKRLDDRHIELVERAQGKLLGTAEMTVSQDGATLTHAFHSPYTDGPAMFVYDRVRTAVKRAVKQAKSHK